ncbi:MAG: hypothetical protein ACTSRW_14300, partial [Candidatus Helarchaeota archaeon]
MELDSTVRLRERITLLEQKIQQKNELITKLELIVSKLKTQIRTFEKDIAPNFVKTIKYYQQKNADLEKTMEKLRNSISNLKSIW